MNRPPSGGPHPPSFSECGAWTASIRQNSIVANPGDFAYIVKQQADIVRIIGEYVKLRKSGAQNYSGLCPFHGEKTPSFSVHASRQYFHCFGCGVSGDVFSFVQKIENITFPEAVRAVAQKLGIAAPKAEFSSPQEAREARTRGLLLDLHEAACLWFQQQLARPEAASAREYLRGRGLDDEAIARFRIGFAPESGFLLRDKLKSLADEDALRESGLFSWKEQAPAAGNVAQEEQGQLPHPIQKKDRMGHPQDSPRCESFALQQISQPHRLSHLQ